MPDAIHQSGATVDLSTRVIRSSVVAASPAAAAETVICTLTIPTDLVVVSGIELVAWAAFTAGTNGVSANLKIRQTGTSGTTIAATGATTVVAANLGTLYAAGFDTAATLPGQVYVATLTVGSGSAPSTVSACYLRVLVV